METTRLMLPLILLALTDSTDGSPLPVQEVVGLIGGTVTISSYTSCHYNHSSMYELNKEFGNGMEMIGQYDGIFEGFHNFTDRLHFAPDSCSFVLSNLTKEDGGNYQVIVYFSVNYAIKTYMALVHINVADPPVPLPISENSTGLNGNTMGLLAVCFSLFPSFQTIVHVGAYFCIMEGGRLFGLFHFVSFYTKYITFACDLASMFSWFMYENPCGLAWVLLVTNSVKAIMMYRSLRHCLKTGPVNRCCFSSSVDPMTDTRSQNVVCKWMGCAFSCVMYLMEHSGFSVCVFIAYFVMFGKYEKRHLIISGAISASVLIIAYLLLWSCYKKSSENQNDGTRNGSEPVQGLTSTESVIYKVCPKEPLADDSPPSACEGHVSMSPAPPLGHE